MVNADSSNTNQTVLYLKWRPRHFDHVVGLALHEGSHIAYSDFEMFSELILEKDIL